MLTQLITRIKEVKAPTGKSSTAPILVLQFGGINFTAPQGWKADETETGLLVVNPKIEKDWQAHLFFENRATSGEAYKTLEEAIDDLVGELTKKKEKFSLLSKRVEKHPHGFSIGRMEYTCVYEGTSLRESEVLVDLEGSKRLYLMTSVADSLAETYHSIFEQVVASFAYPPAKKAPGATPSPVADLAPASPVTVSEKAPLKPSSSMSEINGVIFEIPNQWSLKIEKETSRILSAPASDDGVTPTIHLEFVPISSGATSPAEVLIAERIAGLKSEEEAFQEIKRWAGPDVSGIEIALVEYSSLREKVASTALQMVFQFSTGYFWVRIGSASAAWEKHQEVFAKFVASISSREPGSAEVREFAGLSFIVPEGWSDAPHEGGYVMMDPAVDHGEGTIFIEKKSDQGLQSRTLEEIFADYLPTLESGYAGFTQTQCRVGDHPAGFPFGFVEFTYQRDEESWTQREFVIELDDKNRVYVLLSSKTSGWSEYLPIYDHFVYSLQKA